MAARAQKVEFGIKGGINHAGTVFKNTEDDSERFEGSVAGAHFGGVANITVSSRFSVQPQLLVAMKGGGLVGVKMRSVHAELPINFLYTHQGFFIGGGPNFSYGISGKIIDMPGGDLDLYDSDEAAEYTLKRFDVGVNVLMGYRLPSGLTFSANYTPGLIDVYEGNGNAENIKANTRWFGFSVGYMFGKK